MFHTVTDWRSESEFVIIVACYDVRYFYMSFDVCWCIVSYSLLCHASLHDSVFFCLIHRALFHVTFKVLRCNFFYFMLISNPLWRMNYFIDLNQYFPYSYFPLFSACSSIFLISAFHASHVHQLFPFTRVRILSLLYTLFTILRSMYITTFIKVIFLSSP